MNKHQTQFRAILIILILILVLVFAYSGFRTVGTLVAPKAPVSTQSAGSKTITRDGVEYFPRQDITVFMLMGIDRYGPVEASTSYNNEGAADMVALAVFDETNESYSVLMLNRDTVMEMPVLGIGGRPAGTTVGQLALAHTYGTGLKDSCENIKSAVSGFLYGIEIDHYFSMNMDAISMLNDAVGGVKVTVTDDFSAVDATIPMGEVVLNGEQAFNFVQNRKGIGNQMNLSRMERQKSYINGFLDALNTKLDASETFVVDTYNKIESYVVTNCSVTTLSSMLNRYSDYEFTGIQTPEGENVMTGEFMEYHVDEEKLDTLVLNLFYSEKKF
ncbi:MAG: LCP family protein [Clostridia bacterium]|nr:LCP family protein [Clostridia bacterium]